MDPWPFDDSDWKEIEKITQRQFQATVAEDDIVSDSIRREMLRKLKKLEVKYGEHPVLLETRADNTKDPGKRLELYRRALNLAVKHRHDTLTIRVWLADLLLDEFDDAASAMQVLTDGQHEVLEQNQEKEWVRMYEETLKRITEQLS